MVCDYFHGVDLNHSNAWEFERLLSDATASPSGTARKMGGDTVFRRSSNESEDIQAEASSWIEQARPIKERLLVKCRAGAIGTQSATARQNAALQKQLTRTMRCQAISGYLRCRQPG